MRSREPVHGGYPTPTYEQAPMRRRLTSQRLFGHTGAAVSRAAVSDMFWAGHGAATPSGCLVALREVGRR
jgi:hypothetical protein